MVTKPKYFRGRPIIQPGEVYEIDGIAYKVITAVAEMGGEKAGSIRMSRPVFVLENVATRERVYIGERALQAKFKEESV